MIKKWRLLSKKRVFDSRWIKIEDRAYEVNGKKRLGYLHVFRPDYVLIIARDSSGKILLEKQYRRGVDEITYELPAGWVEESEDPQETCERELFEETGYYGKAGLIGEIYVQPSYMSMKAHVFLVDVEARKNKVKDPESDEVIEAKLFKYPDIAKLIKEGFVKDMGTLSALLLYERSLK